MSDAEKFRRFMAAKAWHDSDFTRFSARRNPRGVGDAFSLRALIEA